MTPQEFKPEWHKIENNYGKYSDAAVKVIFNTLKHMSVDRFSALVDRIIATHINTKYPPGLPHFEKIMTEMSLQGGANRQVDSSREKRRNTVSTEEIMPRLRAYIEEAKKKSTTNEAPNE